MADIGGTNARFALAGLDEAGGIVTAFRQDMANADFPGLEACVSAYLSRLGAAPRPTLAAFGVASPISGDIVRRTKRDWSFSKREFNAKLAWSRFEVVNDFVAIGHALPGLERRHWRALTGPAWPEELPAAVSLVGPGTGFGVGQVLRGEGATIVVPTEGGHASTSRPWTNSTSRSSAPCWVASRACPTSGFYPGQAWSISTGLWPKHAARQQNRRRRRTSSRRRSPAATWWPRTRFSDSA